MPWVRLGHYLLDISFSSNARMTLEIAASVVIIDIFLSYFQKGILVEVKCIINRESNINLTKFCQM